MSTQLRTEVKVCDSQFKLLTGNSSSLICEKGLKVPTTSYIYSHVIYMWNTFIEIEHKCLAKY